MTTFTYPIQPSSLPAGAATSANQVTANNSLAALQSEIVLAAKGPIFRDCSSSSIPSASWADLGTMPTAIKEIQIVENGGGYFYLKDEDSASELAIVPAGYSGNIKLDIPSGKKLQAKAIGADITSGKITITLLG